MKFIKPLIGARLEKRYKRFLADVKLEQDGTELTAHCPNTGAMTGCAEPGMRVWLSDSNNPKRKYRYTWELAETASGDRICVHTQRANTVAGEALQQGLIPAYADVKEWRAEVKYGSDNRRIDWVGEDAQGRSVYIEVKSVTLAESAGQGFFPDTTSVRATQHLHSLIEMTSAGHRAGVLYVVLHSGIERVSAAAHIDAKYAETVSLARKQGVQFHALKCAISQHGIDPVGELPVM